MTSRQQNSVASSAEDQNQSQSSTLTTPLIYAEFRSKSTDAEELYMETLHENM